MSEDLSWLDSNFEDLKEMVDLATAGWVIAIEISSKRCHPADRMDEVYRAAARLSGEHPAALVDVEVAVSGDLPIQTMRLRYGDGRERDLVW